MRLRRVLACFGVCALALLLLRAWPHAPIAARYGTSVAIYDAAGALLRLTTARDERYRLWTALDEVRPELVQAFLLHEDRHFYRHPGVNPVALVRGAFRTYVAGQPRQGGSTITMQLARLMYRLNTRTVRGKVTQIGAAFWLEARYGKREILEAYLNLVPFGANIEGVGAASVVYFGKPAARLALNEALTLAIVPQSPARRVLSGADQAAIAAARARVVREWQATYPTSSEQAALLSLPLALRAPAELPFRVPHLTTQLARSRATHVDTLIEPRLQATLERVTRTYVERRRSQGIRNAAALLVDTQSMAVTALVGSVDFHDAAIQGQVNGTQAKRSPGSTLKPFIYALGFDQGLIHPMSVLADAPASFGTFQPENFDGGFAGPISVQEALNRSRNVPAVAVAGRLTAPSLHQFLRDAGVTRLAEERRYGLALALGAAELTMEELVRLYAMLANEGRLQPLRYRADDPMPADAPRLITPEAAFMTLEMLRANPRPDGLGASARVRTAVGWKTGTSWGFRDAWTVGLFGRYVLAVWIGNFDGAGNPAFVGGKAAAPLFFQLVDAIETIGSGPPRTHTPPANLIRAEVCAASGDLPNAECPRTVSTWFVPGRSPIRVSEVHRRVAIDTRTGRLACADTEQRFVRTAVYEYWPSDLARVFALAGMPRATPAAGDCADTSNRADRGIAPAIVSPLSGATYTLRPGRLESIALAARADGAARSLHWFVDDRYIGAATPQSSLAWEPRTTGRYTVRVVDDRGQADTRVLLVAPAP